MKIKTSVEQKMYAIETWRLNEKKIESVETVCVVIRKVYQEIFSLIFFFTFVCLLLTSISGHLYLWSPKSTTFSRPQNNSCREYRMKYVLDIFVNLNNFCLLEVETCILHKFQRNLMIAVSILSTLPQSIEWKFVVFSLCGCQKVQLFDCNDCRGLEVAAAI